MTRNRNAHLHQHVNNSNYVNYPYRTSNIKIKRINSENSNNNSENIDNNETAQTANFKNEKESKNFNVERQRSNE